MQEALIITAALAGGATSKNNNPATPYTPEEFAAESYRCLQEGVSIVHIHAKDPSTGMATAEVKQIKQTIAAIRDRCPDLIINLTTGYPEGVSPDERIAPVMEIKPEMASLNVNSMNMGFGDYKKGALMYEFVYTNPFSSIERFGRTMRVHKVKPEIEIFDPGGINNTLFIRRQGDVFAEPMHFQFVYGVLGGMVFTPHLHLALMGQLPEKATYSVCGVGPHQVPAAFMSVICGGHVRIGLEDNVRMPDGTLAKGSWEQTTWVKELASIYGRPVATPDEARKILTL